MTSVMIAGATGSSSVMPNGTIGDLVSIVGARRAILVADATVHSLHRSSFPEWPLLAVEPGETSKSLATVERLYRDLVRLEADRETVLIGIGGGVVCDIVGFAASTFLRGVPFGFVPTTLLAQVDAAIGGKNGVNLDGYKNLVGTFRQPEFVLCDHRFLSTLPAAELRNGFAEAVKAGAIGDARLFDFLSQNVGKIKSLDAAAIRTVITDAVNVKVSVVRRDETEKNLRRILNFGHTLGHALEKAYHLAHGEAVSIGMVREAELSVRKGFLQESDCGRLRSLLVALGLPVDLPVGSKDVLIDAMRKDKKRANDVIHMVFLHSIGRAVDMTMPVGDLEDLLA